jgi:hypothetical protein
MKIIFRISLIVLIALVAGLGDAQQITSPVMTYVPDNAGRLHPVLGIPAAASVGAPLNVGFGIGGAVMPPAHDYLLATTNDSRWPVLLQIHGDNVTARSIQQSETGIERVALSPSGSAAGLFSEAEGRIYAFASLSQSPVLLGHFPVGALGHLSAFAISDDGRNVIVGTSDGASGSLYFLASGGQPRLIASIRHAKAIQFLWHSNTAVIADDIDNKVYGFTGGQVFPLATEKDGISVPAAIAVASDNAKAFVINSGSQSVTRIGPYGAVADPVHCDCILTGLYPTTTDSVYRITNFSGGPVLLFDGSSRVPRMIFVPVGSQN